MSNISFKLLHKLALQDDGPSNTLRALLTSTLEITTADGQPRHSEQAQQNLINHMLENPDTDLSNLEKFNAAIHQSPTETQATSSTSDMPEPKEKIAQIRLQDGSILETDPSAEIGSIYKLLSTKDIPGFPGDCGGIGTCQDCIAHVPKSLPPSPTHPFLPKGTRLLCQETALSGNVYALQKRPFHTAPPSLSRNPLTLQLPNQVTCTIEATDVALKGQTVSSSYKPATLDNGIKIQVPPFIESGDKIIVDTRTIEYVKKV